MTIERPDYIEQLVAKSWNGKVKIITGIRRSGKSFLLSTLYKDHLVKQGVKADSFVMIDLEKAQHTYIRDHLPHKELINEGTWIHVAL